MQVGSEEEFYIVVGLGLGFAGTMVALVLVMIGIRIYQAVRDGKKIKKLYEQERKNGRAGSHGRF